MTPCAQDMWEHHSFSPAPMVIVCNVKLSGFDFGTVKPNNDVVDDVSFTGLCVYRYVIKCVADSTNMYNYYVEVKTTTILKSHL